MKNNGACSLPALCTTGAGTCQNMDYGMVFNLLMLLVVTLHQRSRGRTMRKGRMQLSNLSDLQCMSEVGSSSCCSVA